MHRHRCCLIGVAIAFAAASDVRTQQLQWRPLPPRSLGPCVMAHDVARDRFVVLGDATYEWDGRSLQRRPTAQSPTLVRPGLAYDLGRRRTVAFGGSADGVGRLWEFDGADWSPITAATAPPPRERPALAYDIVHGVVVLFGGSNRADTWTWDGAVWRPIATPGPAAIAAPAMAFHLGTQRMVLFTGAPANATWTFDGATWTQVQPSTTPVGSSTSRMCTDVQRDRVHLLVERSPPLWSWDGVDWTPSIPVPEPYVEAGFACDLNGHTLLVGGNRVVTSAPFFLTLTRPRAEVWQIDASGGQRLDEGGPPPGQATQLAYDASRARVVAYNVMPESVDQTATWEWDRDRWYEVPSLRLPHTIGTRICYDDGRGVTVRFGGIAFNGLFPSLPNDLHELSASGWTALAPGGPAGRMFHTMVYDPLRAVVMLFGGTNLASPLGDTWLWDGTSWTQVLGAGPPARQRHQMAFDIVRGRAVLFGGVSSPGVLTDTWEWDGTVWSQQNPAHSPVARADAAMGYDVGLERCLLVGGYGVSSQPLDEICSWDGTDWTITPQTLPRLGAQTSNGEATVPIGPGEWLRTVGGQAWIGTATPAAATAVGTGCGALPAPRLTWFGEPALGRRFTVELLDGVGSSPLLVGFGVGTANVPIGGGCAVHLPSLELALFAVADSNGHAFVELTVPGDPRLLGVVVSAQVGQVASASPLGLALTNGLELRVGH